MSQEAFTTINNSPAVPIIVNVPHSSTYIPDEYRNCFLLNDEELHEEMLSLTDWYTDELYAPVHEQGGAALIYKVSRLLVDPERFQDDSKEVLASRGMGVIYTRTSHGRILRKPFTDKERETLLDTYYRPYHLALEHMTERLVNKFGKCLILDGHSFPGKALPYEIDQDAQRPHVCLGTDAQHTPESVSSLLEAICRRWKMTVKRNAPFAGTIIPSGHYGDERVLSVMIEIKRSLYMDESTGKKNDGWGRTKSLVADMVENLIKEI